MTGRFSSPEHALLQKSRVAKMAMPESTASFKLKMQQSSSSVIKSEDNYYDGANKDRGTSTGGIIQINNQESA